MVNEEQDPGQTAGNKDPDVELKVYDSFEELQKADSIQSRCVSELPGIELLKGDSGRLYLLADRERIIPKNTLIGGFGTGKPLNGEVMKFVPYRPLLNVSLQ